MPTNKPFFLSRRAHQLRLSEIVTFQRQLRTLESRIDLLTAAKQQFNVNIREHEGHVRPLIASALRDQGI